MSDDLPPFRHLPHTVPRHAFDNGEQCWKTTIDLIKRTEDVRNGLVRTSGTYVCQVCAYTTTYVSHRAYDPVDVPIRFGEQYRSKGRLWTVLMFPTLACHVWLEFPHKLQMPDPAARQVNPRLFFHDECGTVHRLVWLPINRTRKARRHVLTTDTDLPSST